MWKYRLYILFFKVLNDGRVWIVRRCYTSRLVKWRFTSVWYHRLASINRVSVMNLFPSVMTCIPSFILSRLPLVSLGRLVPLMWFILVFCLCLSLFLKKKTTTKLFTVSPGCLFQPSMYTHPEFYLLHSTLKFGVNACATDLNGTMSCLALPCRVICSLLFC